MDVLRKLSEGKKQDDATPYIRVRQITHFAWKRINCIFVGFVFANLSIVVSIDFYVGFIIFQRKISRTSIDIYIYICNNVSSPCERKSLISIFHTTPSTQCEKYYGLMGRKHVEHSIQLHATALLPELLFCTRAEQYYSILPELGYDLWENTTITRRAIIFLVNRSS